MADFVGLLKKTIEAQSQMTPQLRQRIYERARATVERKLTDSQAPASIVERQREILTRAIDEVEAYYHQRDEANAAPTPEPEPQLRPERDAAFAPSSPPPLSEEQVETPAKSAPADFDPPPPFEEAFAREDSQNPSASPTSPPPVPDASPFLAEPAGDDSPKNLAQPVVLEAPALPAAPALPEATQVPAQSPSIRPEIPSLAALLNGEETGATPAPDELPPLDLPFLGADSEAEHQNMVTDKPTAPIAPPIEAALNAPATPLKAEPEAPIKRASSPFEDYLPHWQTEEKAAPVAAPPRSTTAELPPFSSVPFSASPSVAPFPVSSPSVDLPPLNKNVTAPTRAESEIDRARREIEALRTGTAPDAPINAAPREEALDQSPFSPLDLPPLPIEPEPQAPVMVEKQADTVTSEADFNNDLVSEIFVQAAKREQKQSTKKRRMTAFIITAIVLAVLAAIAGVLVLTNEYQIGELVGQRPGQATTSSDTDADSTADSSNGELTQTEATAADSQKITRRLLPNGQVVDPGPAVDDATPGEGSSQTSASLPQIDNSARAVFYEAPTDILSSTANDGRVDWSLQRVSPIGQEQGQNQAENLAIVGDVKIPALDMTLRLTMRRNHEETMPADYLTEVVFVLPDDFEGEAIEEIGPILFKASEQSTGQELAGTVTAKVQDNLFLMAVRAPQPILERNLALMRQLPWLKLNVLYKNGRVGEFSIAKGEGGQRIFQRAIDEWSRQGMSEFGELSNAAAAPLADLEQSSEPSTTEDFTPAP